MDVVLSVLKWSAAVGAVALLIMALKPLLDRRFAPKWRYYLWMVLALALMLSPMRWEELLPAMPEPAVEVTVPEVRLPVARPARRENTGAAGNAARPAGNAADPAATVKPAGTNTAPAVNNAENEPGVEIRLSDVLTAVWIAGAALFAGYHVLGTLWYSRRARRWSMTAGAQLKEIYGEVLADMEIKRAPALRVSRAVDSPMVMGLIRPVMYLPEKYMEPEEASFILRHELTHVKRADLWYKLLMLAANAMHWFNPAVWLMRRNASETVELLCDEGAVTGADRSARVAYCEMLLSSVSHERGVSRAVLSTHFGGGARSVKNRFKNLLAGGRKFGWTALLAAVLAVSVAACAVGIGEKEGGERPEQPSQRDNEQTDPPVTEPTDHPEPTIQPPKPVQAAPGADRPKTTEISYYGGIPAEYHVDPATLFAGNGFSLYIADEGWEYYEEPYGGYTAQGWKSTIDDTARFWIVNLGQKSWEEAQQFARENEPDFNFIEDQRGGLMGDTDAAGYDENGEYICGPYMDVYFGYGPDHDYMLAAFALCDGEKTPDEIDVQIRVMLETCYPGTSLSDSDYPAVILPWLYSEEFAGFDELSVPKLQAFKLRLGEVEKEKLMERAEKAATALWGSYTVNEYGWLVSDVREDEYYERICVSDGRISFFASYGDRESDGFSRDKKLTADEAIKTARAFTDAFGLQELTNVEPDIWVDPRYDGAEVLVSWPLMVDGAPIKDALKVNIIGDKVEHMVFNAWVPERITDETPEIYIDDPEDALYCVNCARKTVRPIADESMNSMFFKAQKPTGVTFEWVEQYGEYVPAYKFGFTNDGVGEDAESFNAIVYACTGYVRLDQGYGECFLSPYIL